MEEFALSQISKMKSQHLSLFPAYGGAITAWLYHPKWKHLEMASYPKLATDDATGEHYEDQEEQGNSYVPTWLVETSTQRCVLHAQLQQQLYSVLQTSFGEHEKKIFSNFAIIHDMTAADDQQPRPMHEEDRERNFALTIAGPMERMRFWQ
jgi:hypothetical protein